MINFDEFSFVHILGFTFLVAIVTTIYCVRNLKQNHDRCFIIAADVKRNNKTGFYGRWVQRDATLKQTCNFPFRSKCCQKQQHLKFVFNEENLNRVDPITAMHQILNNKSLALIGDSLMREFYTGIKELLFLNKTIGRKTNLSNLSYTKADRINVNASGHVFPSNLPDIVSRHDVIVLNQGIHYNDALGMVVTHFRSIGHLFHRLVQKTSKRVLAFLLFNYMCLLVIS